MISRLAHVCLVTPDLAATERFYCSCLGLEKTFDFVRAGEVVGFYLRVADGTYIEVFRQPAVQDQAAHPLRHICFEVEDIDATIRHLKSQGVEVTAKKMGADHSWQAWTADPAGVKIEFHQYTPESTQLTGEACVLP